MDEIECPYCEHGFDLCHDDGAYYNEEDKPEECECPKCEKNFLVYSQQDWSFTGQKADCLNGSPHNWEPQSGYPNPFHFGRFDCKDCGAEERRDEEGRKKAIEEYRKQNA